MEILVFVLVSYYLYSHLGALHKMVWFFICLVGILFGMTWVMGISTQTELPLFIIPFGLLILCGVIAGIKIIRDPHLTKREKWSRLWGR